MERIDVELVASDVVDQPGDGEERASVMSYNKHRNKPSQSGRSREIILIFEYLTSLAHISILLFVALILFLCFLGEFVFFTWHPLLLSIGWMLLMSEGILTLSPHNILTGSVPKAAKTRLHAILQGLGSSLITVGFIIIYVNKNYKNSNHFVSWHGLLGFISIIGCLTSCLIGLATWYRIELHYISPKICKFAHYSCGICTYLFGGMTLILSIYTKWFGTQTGNSNIIFVFGLALVTCTVAWTLFKPVEGFYKKFIKFFVILSKKT